MAITSVENRQIVKLKDALGSPSTIDGKFDANIVITPSSKLFQVIKNHDDVRLWLKTNGYKLRVSKLSSSYYLCLASKSSMELARETGRIKADALSAVYGEEYPLGVGHES